MKNPTTNHSNQREQRQDVGVKVRGVCVVRGKKNIKIDNALPTYGLYVHAFPSNV